MRLKICLSVVIILCTYASGFAIKETEKISSKEWHCTNMCKSCDGETFFDKLTEKCYCSLKKGNSLEDKNCRDAMRMTAKANEIHLILKELAESSNRVRRDEAAVEITTPKPEETTEPILAKVNPETNIETTTLAPENPKNVPTNTKTKTKSAIERRVRPISKINKTKGAAEAKPIDDLVAEAQQKVEEFVVIHKQNPKEAQTKIKDIQGTFNKVANRLKHNTEPPTVQERINQLEERFASRHNKTTSTPSTLIVEPKNLIEPEENAIVGSKKHPIPKRPALRRLAAEENEENAIHKKPALRRLAVEENEENPLHKRLTLRRLAAEEKEENPIHKRPALRRLAIEENEEAGRLKARLASRRFRERVASIRHHFEPTTLQPEQTTRTEETPIEKEELKINEAPKAIVNAEITETSPVNNEV